MAMTRTQLNQVFREALMSEFADIPCEEQISFVFSEKFEQKMKKLIVRQKKSYWKYVNTAKKRVAIAVISLLSVLMVALNNEEVKASMLQWCENVYQEYIHYYFEGGTTRVIEHEYQLTMIPEGFEKVYELKDQETIVSGYENASGDYIQLEQYVTEDFETYIDNEKGKWSTVTIGDKEVKLCEHIDLMAAMWIEDGYYMFLVYHGCDDVEIIKEIVENVK